MTNIINREEFMVIDFLLYRSYCAQRERGFDPKTCSEFMYDQMKMFFPEMEIYETFYKGRD